MIAQVAGRIVAAAMVFPGGYRKSPEMAVYPV